MFTVVCTYLCMYVLLYEWLSQESDTLEKW